MERRKIDARTMDSMEEEEALRLRRPLLEEGFMVMVTRMSKRQ